MASQGTSLQLFQDGYDLLAPRGLSSFPMLGRFLTQQKSVVGELQTFPVRTLLSRLAPSAVSSRVQWPQAAEVTSLTGTKVLWPLTFSCQAAVWV